MTIGKRLLSIAVLLALGCLGSAHSTPADASRWKTEAAAVTITRDDWGIAHVHGKTDADAVFGMAYTQAEDDFNRVETNYLNSLGWLAQAEGEWQPFERGGLRALVYPFAGHA